MKFIDSSQLLILNADEVCALPEEKVQHPENFKVFSKGIKIDPEQLFSQKWQNASIGNDYKSLCDFIMKEMLPAFYDHNYLLTHGEIGIVITGIANYTLAPINGCVVGMDGLPVDFITQQESFSFCIDPNILMAFCRGLTLQVSEAFLENDDEWEDRELNIAELNQYGMPAGGSDLSTNPIACLSDFLLGGGSSCQGNFGPCMVNSDLGGNLCSVDISGCALNGGGGTVCGTNVGACAAAVGGGAACGAATSACAANIGTGSFCGSDASACGADMNAGSSCGAKASACGVDILGFCPANAVVCGVNLPGDFVGACIVNIIPGLPSC